MDENTQNTPEQFEQEGATVETAVTEPAVPGTAPVKKKKKKIAENWFVLCIITYAFLFAGEIMGSMITNVPIGLWAGIKGGMEGMDPEYVATHITDIIPDWIYTAAMYFMFIGIWIFMLLMMLIPLFKPVYKAIGTKTKGNNVVKFLIGLLIGFGMNGVCILAAYLNGDIKLYFDSFRPFELIVVFIAVLVQSSAEELVCRGFLYQMIRKNYKPWVAIVVNSCFFGALHLMNPGAGILPILDIVVCGVLFSFMVYYMDSIWAAMAAHAAWNYCQNIIFGLLNSGQEMPFSIFKLDAASARNSFAYDVNFGVEGSILSIAVQVVVAIAIFVWGYTKKKKPTDIWAEENTETVSAEAAA